MREPLFVTPDKDGYWPPRPTPDPDFPVIWSGDGKTMPRLVTSGTGGMHQGDLFLSGPLAEFIRKLFVY